MGATRLNVSLQQRIHAFMHPGAVTHVADPNRRLFEVPFAAERGLRRGMWVVQGRTVGILIGLSAGAAQVQLVEADGTNRMTLQAQPNGEQLLVPHILTLPVEGLKQAGLEDIPEPRRPPPGIAARFGYHARGTR